MFFRIMHFNAALAIFLHKTYFTNLKTQDCELYQTKKQITKLKTMGSIPNDSVFIDLFLGRWRGEMDVKCVMNGMITFHPESRLLFRTDPEVWKFTVELQLPFSSNKELIQILGLNVKKNRVGKLNMYDIKVHRFRDHLRITQRECLGPSSISLLGHFVYQLGGNLNVKISKEVEGETYLEIISDPCVYHCPITLTKYTYSVEHSSCSGEFIQKMIQHCEQIQSQYPNVNQIQMKMDSIDSNLVLINIVNDKPSRDRFPTQFKSYSDYTAPMHTQVHPDEQFASHLCMYCFKQFRCTERDGKCACPNICRTNHWTDAPEHCDRVGYYCKWSHERYQRHTCHFCGCLFQCNGSDATDYDDCQCHYGRADRWYCLGCRNEYNPKRSLDRGEEIQLMRQFSRNYDFNQQCGSNKRRRRNNLLNHDDFATIPNNSIHANPN
jgi:hypothetical protein